MLFPKTAAFLAEATWAPWRSDQQRVLYHYTTAQGLYGIVTQKKLRLTHVRHLNDESEGLYGAQAVDHALDSIRNAYKDSELIKILSPALKQALGQEEVPISGGTFLGCFSILKDSLPQWRGYGRYDSSFAMAIDAEKLLKLANDRWAGRCWLLPVLYDKDQFLRTFAEALVIASGEFDESKSNHNPVALVMALLRQVANYGTALKHPAFREEQEWRLIFLSLPGDPDPKIQHLPSATFRPYVELDLEPDFLSSALIEVVVGPQNNQKAMLHGAASFLREQTGREIPVVKSEVPYNAQI